MTHVHARHCDGGPHVHHAPPVGRHISDDQCMEFDASFPFSSNTRSYHRSTMPIAVKPYALRRVIWIG